MLPAPAPTPPPHPPPVRTDTRPIEPDEQWKTELRRRIELSLRHMVEDAQTVRDTILSSQPSEGSRERAQREYEESMNNIRMLAQDEFNRELRIEMSERRWALDVVDSNSPDVARQQQWILDNIRKGDEDRTLLVNTDAPQNAEGVLSASPQGLGDSERASDESLEGGYGSAIPEDEESGSDQSMESEEGEEEEDEDEEDEEEGEGDVQPRQSRPPSRPNVSLTQPLHSRSPVSRRDAQSRQRQPSNFRSAEDHDDEDAGDSPVPAHPARPREAQLYSPSGPPRRQSSGSQAPVWSRGARPAEPSGLSRTFAHASGQMYSPSPVQFPRRGSVNSTGSNSSGAGLHRAGSLNSDQHRSNGVVPHNPHNGTERPPTQARDRIASNIGPRERQMSASASPHDRPSPPTYPTVAPRAIPGARPPPLDDAVRFPTSGSPGSRTLFSMQRSPEDTRQGIAIPRGPTTPEEGPRGASWSSLHSRRSYGDFNVHRRHNSKGDRLPPVDGDISDASDDVVGELDDRQSIRSMRSLRSMRSMELEQVALYWEAEARRKEEEGTRKEEEANKKEDEARRLEEKARQSLEEAKRLEAGARQAEASAKMREAAAQKKEAEAKLKEAEAQKREAEAQKREAELRRKEDMARHREHEAKRKEEQARWKEEEAQRKEEEARKREEEVRRKEDDARKREDDARKREEDAREREKLARQKEEDARRFEEEARKKEEEARRKEDEARRKKEEAKRIELDYERKKREIEQRLAELEKREAELSLKEQAARLVQEELEARRPADETSWLESEATSPIDAEELTFEAEDAAKADTSNRTPEDLARQAQDAESTAPEQERQPKAKGRKGSKTAKRQKDKALEEQRLKEQGQQRLEEQRLLEEKRRLEEQRLLEEKRLEEERLQRERAEQIRLDEELSRQEQARLVREAVLEQERLQREAEEREANRIREEQLRAAEEARYRQLDEQRRRVAEQGRQQQYQQDEIAKQRAKEVQQKEFERREAQYYQRTLERERQNSMGASFEAPNVHRSGSTTNVTGSASDRSSASSTFSSSTGSTWSSRPSSMNSSHTSNSSFSSSSVPLSSTPRPSPTSTARPGAPGTSPYAAKLDETEWARRAEERARHQQEQFKREQERLESERQTKSAKVLSREELIRLYEHHENKWRQLKDSDNLGWNSFAWPVFKRPSEPEDMTTTAISAYVHSKYAPGADKSPKDRIKDHLKRWHPDKFETRILPRVAEEERERVKTGAGIVVRGLNELLNRNYED